MKSIQNMMSKKSSFQNLKHFADKRVQQGVTAVELIIGLAVIGLVVAGVAVTAQSTFRDQKVNEEVQRLQILTGKMRAYIATSADTAGITTATAIAGRMVSDDSISGATINSKFAKPIYIVPAKTTNANDGIQIIYADLKTEECINLAKAGAASFWGVGTTAAASAAAPKAEVGLDKVAKTANGNFKDDQLSAGCGNSAGRDLVFTMAKN